MKIVFANKDKTNLQYHLGLAKVLNFCGHECVMWDMNAKSSMDAFREMVPDVIFANTKDIDDGFVVGAKDVCPYCFLSVSPDTSLVFKELDNCKRLSDSLTFKVCLTFPASLETTRKLTKYWENFDLLVNPSLTAGDVFVYSMGKAKDEFLSDVTFIGEPTETSEQYMAILCRPDSPFKTKIFGGEWGVMQECGNVSQEHYPDILASASICPVFNNKIKDEYVINDMFWNMAVSKHFCITNDIPELRQLFDSSDIASFSTKEEFLSLIEKFTSNLRLRNDYVSRIQKIVLDNHTYFHRLAKLFTYVSLPKHANICMDKLDEFKGK